MGPIRSLARTKTIEQSIADAAEPGHRLKRSLSAFDLMILGVAVAVGAGIFSIGARAAGDFPGPAVTVAFVLAALTCAPRRRPPAARRTTGQHRRGGPAAHPPGPAARLPGAVLARAADRLGGAVPVPMLNLTTLTWARFVAWLAIGIAVYFAYGRRHSRVGLAARAAGN